ncbi:hypothetical protein [Streptomyces sp. NPDC018045]|uniref:hypothetical protein n=1 Tax=Streptomyces sp. NPDC018045 TaxID=3365037 RepID=UPI00378EFB90
MTWRTSPMTWRIRTPWAGARPRTRVTPRRRATALAAVALGALVPALASCGIRGTSVPVDAGGAPSRVSCEVPAGSVPPVPPDGSRVTVYLECGSALAPVERTVTRPEQQVGDRLRAARALLDELQEQPGPVEEEAGFSTAVPEGLEVSGPRAGDPRGTLRLSARPEDLPSFALAQIVCTFGESAALDRTHAAVLGGPGDGHPQRYPCSAEVRAHPDSVLGGGSDAPATSG